MNTSTPSFLHTDNTSAYLARPPRHIRFVKQALRLSSLMHMAFAALFLTLQVWPMVVASVCCMGVFAGCLAASRPKHFAFTHRWAIPFALLGHSVFATLWLGNNTGFQLYAWMLPLLAAVNPYQKAPQKLLRVALYVTFSVSYELWLNHHSHAMVTLSDSALIGLRAFNLAAFLLLLSALAYTYAMTVNEAETQLRQHAMTDDLTGLFNRRRMHELADQEMSRARRNDSPLCVLLMDIDFFKSINDSHGHQAGDQAIAQLAHCLQHQLRQQDPVARWGGEEFLALLTDTSLESACATAERLRRLIADTPLRLGEETLPLTASFGVCQWQPGETFEHCIARADAALYAAKQAGRNQVHSGEIPLSDPAVSRLLNAPHMQRQVLVRRSNQPEPANHDKASA